MKGFSQIELFFYEKSKFSHVFHSYSCGLSSFIRHRFIAHGSFMRLLKTCYSMITLCIIDIIINYKLNSM